MAMIQGIDGGVLLQALRAGRSDRMDDMAFQAKQEAARREAEKQKQIGGLMGQLFGSQQPSSGGVSGNFAPPNPQTTAQPQNFSEAFGNGIPAEGAVEQSAAPTVAPQIAPQAPQRRYNPEVLAQLIALDPETGGKMVTAFKQMDEANLKALETKNTALGATAAWLSRVPEDERQGALQSVLPQLLAAGWTQEEIAGRPLTNQALRGYQAQAMDVDTIIDNTLAEREFLAGKTVPVTAGGSVAVVRPTVDPLGNVTGTSQEYIIGGGGETSGTSPNIAAPQSKADYDALPPGATYRAPDGTVRTKPGGGASNGTGTFRP